MHLKTKSRMKKIIEQYAETFKLKHYLCQGVMFYVPNSFAHKEYQNEIENLPKELKNRFLLISDLEQLNLKQNYFGEKLNSPVLNPYCSSKRPGSGSSRAARDPGVNTKRAWRATPPIRPTRIECPPTAWVEWPPWPGRR